MESQSRKMRETGVYEHTYLDVRSPRFSFDDIAGYSEIKERLHDMVVLPLRHGEQLEKAGITPPTGVIVWGPLGTGKGHLIEAAAKAAEVSYVIIRGRECTDHAEVIRAGFQFALESRPCVVHLMDIDWLAPRKDADYSWSDGSCSGRPDRLGSPEVHRAVHEEVAKVAFEKDIMVLASCYRIDVLDQAFTRTSMLGRKIYVPRPGREDRAEIIGHYLRGVELDFDVEALAERTEYFVGWDLEALCRKAKLLAMRRNSSQRLRLSEEDVELALEKVRPWLTPEMASDYDRIFNEDCIHKYNF